MAGFSLRVGASVALCADAALYGINQFKIDGAGNAGQAFPSSIFDSDFSVAIHLIEQLRPPSRGASPTMWSKPLSCRPEP